MLCSRLAVRELHTSPVLGKRIGKRVRQIPEWRQANQSQGPWWRTPQVVPRAPLARTPHPASRFAAAEAELAAAVVRASASDLPLDSSAPDPYQAAPSCCLLCPRRYAPGQAPAPSYLNPKLLSQYTSAHTGLVYPRHITGLCSAMQARVELEALRSQQAGLMSTRVRADEYLQDPQLVTSDRPFMPNPH